MTFLEPVSLSLLCQHRREQPFGVAGGEPGSTGRQRLVRSSGEVVELAGIDQAEAEPGDRLVLETPGGGMGRMNRMLSVLLGAVIAAAFLGPGTVTTAARAGVAHRYGLLWALVFATVACLVLQEASARLTIASGRNLGEALRLRFGHGGSAIVVIWLALSAIVIGCAAYEAGNILGGVVGLSSQSPFLLRATANEDRLQDARLLQYFYRL